MENIIEQKIKEVEEFQKKTQTASSELIKLKKDVVMRAFEPVQKSIDDGAYLLIQQHNCGIENDITLFDIGKPRKYSININDDDDDEYDIYSYLSQIRGNAEIYFDKSFIITKKKKDDFISFNIDKNTLNTSCITLDMNRIYEGLTTFHVVSSLDDVKKMINEWFIKYDDYVKQRLDKKKTELSEIKF